MATTFLQMINRVRQEGRHQAVASIDANDELTVVVSDLINTAKRDVLESEEWNFDVRHDGVLETVARRDYTTMITTAGSTNIVISGESDRSEYANGTAVSKIVVESDTTYGDVSFRIVTASDLAGADQYYPDVTSWPGDTAATATGQVYADEYVLPSTVRDVLSVRDEDGDVRLEFVDKHVRFDTIVPAPHRTGSSTPDIVFVGSTLTPTQLSGGTTVTAGLGMMIHPVPDAAYVLRYSYRYQHPDMSATTDTLAGVPERVVDDIVGVAKELAFSNHVFNDPRLAAFHRERNEDSRRRSKAMDNPQPMRRMRLGTHVGRRGAGSSRVEDAGVFYKP